MAVTDEVLVTHFTEDPDTGAVEMGFEWAGSNWALVYESKAYMLLSRTPALRSQAEAETVILNWWLARDPDASNLSLVVGKTFKIDYSDPNPVKVN